MLTEAQKSEIKTLLEKNRGKIFSVKFRKKNGEVRTLNGRQAVKGGVSPLKGGDWAGGNAGKPADHNLILCTDLNLEKQGKHSRRSFKLDSVLSLKAGGVSISFEEK